MTFYSYFGGVLQAEVPEMFKKHWSNSQNVDNNEEASHTGRRLLWAVSAVFFTKERSAPVK